MQIHFGKGHGVASPRQRAEMQSLLETGFGQKNADRRDDQKRHHERVEGQGEAQIGYITE
jgi:hypothetical protein